jgi:protein gp37
MSVETSIGWAKETVNPIKGLCPEEYRCSYCYVPPIYKHWGWDTKPRLHLSAFDKVRKRRKPTRYFLCSTHDLFGPWVADEWIHNILDEVIDNHRHTFCILTKYPARLAGYRNTISSNCWVGTTITSPEDFYVRVPALSVWPHRLRFASFEPLLAEIQETREEYWSLLDWIIIGAQTLPGGRTKQPEREWVESLISQAERHKIPIFLKDNLNIWGLIVPQQPDGSFKRQEVP